MRVVITKGEHEFVLEGFHSMTYNETGKYLNIFSIPNEEIVPICHTLFDDCIITLVGDDE